MRPAQTQSLNTSNLDDWIRAVKLGDRRALARAITQAESTRPDHRATALDILETLLPQTGQTIRVGISGIPGVGKSTFIEALGNHVVSRGHRLAVLAVDPSSSRTGGSILGDKTRMETLTQNPEVFIRPSPAAGSLGGVARRTREAMLLCEASGFNFIIVETVGVGQSETAVADMVDLLLLLLPPAGGDELQGIKKGIVESADLFVVNKADGDLKAAARHSAADYRSALHFLRPANPSWSPPVLTCSALRNEGVEAVYQSIMSYVHIMTDPHAAGNQPTTSFESKRADQARAWMWSEIGDSLTDTLRSDRQVNALLPDLEHRVQQREISPGRAAQQILAVFLGKN
ncbi:MAG: methylmalonyl Co-A mutase-associated GTPase MeaB [Pseudomonadota bacterium]